MITDEMTEKACETIRALSPNSVRVKMRAALEAVAPLIIHDAMAEMAVELRAIKGCHDFAKVFEAYAKGIETVQARTKVHQ